MLNSFKFGNHPPGYTMTFKNHVMSINKFNDYFMNDKYKIWKFRCEYCDGLTSKRYRAWSAVMPIETIHNLVKIYTGEGFLEHSLTIICQTEPNTYKNTKCSRG